MTDLTIVTPVFNGSEFIEETINSVLRKTSSEVVFEYIIINDGSSDSTPDILQEYLDNPKVKVINQENQGEVSAINVGLKSAKGTYVLVVNADDPILSADLIPSSIAILNENPSTVCVYPDWQIIDKLGKVLSTKTVMEYSEAELIGNFNCLPGPGAIFRREQALKIGGRRNWKFVSDYDFWLRLSRFGQFQRNPRVLAQWRSHENSTTVSMKSLEMALERIQVIETFVSENDLPEELGRKAVSSAYYFASRLVVFCPDIPARKWLLTSFRKRGSWPQVANPLVVLFILTMPLSRYLLRVAAPFSKRLKHVF